VLREQAERARRVAEEETEPADVARALARASRREAAAADVDPPSDDDEPPAGDLPTHRPQTTRGGLPKPQAQRNFTAPDSRIMKRGGGYVQACNCQAVVDGDSWVIVAQGVSNQPADTYYLVPMLARAEASTGTLPARFTADAGYWAPSNAAWCEERGIDAYISTQRHRRSASEPDPPEPAVTPQQRMRDKVASPEGRKIYRLRKCIPEPVFGQIKHAMGFRRFMMRGMAKAAGEWALVCTCHNVLKLWRSLAATGLPALA